MVKLGSDSLVIIMSLFEYDCSQVGPYNKERYRLCCLPFPGETDMLKVPKCLCVRHEDRKAGESREDFMLSLIHI